MTNHVATNKTLEKIKQAVRNRLEERQRDWEEMRDRLGEQGYRPSECVHGTNLWTDYDPMCLACEEGLSMEEEALLTAQQIYGDVDTMMKQGIALIESRKFSCEVNEKVYAEVIERINRATEEGR